MDFEFLFVKRQNEYFSLSKIILLHVAYYYSGLLLVYPDFWRFKALLAGRPDEDFGMDTSAASGV